MQKKISCKYFLYAINPQGTLAWRCKINAPIWSSPVINTAGQIVCGSSNIARLDTDLEPVTDFEDLDPPIEKFTVDRDGNIKHRNGDQKSQAKKDQVGCYHQEKYQEQLGKRIGCIKKAILHSAEFYIFTG